ncbi:MAG: hypothetical protein Q7V05_12665 [Methanoregula sp.]|nr:hypothetical protein [Methanoregula sp.]
MSYEINRISPCEKPHRDATGGAIPKACDGLDGRAGTNGGRVMARESTSGHPNPRHIKTAVGTGIQ